MLEVLIMLGVFVLTLEAFERVFENLRWLHWKLVGQKRWAKQWEKQEKKARKRSK